MLTKTRKIKLIPEGLELVSGTPVEEVAGVVEAEDETTQWYNAPRGTFVRNNILAVGFGKLGGVVGALRALGIPFKEGVSGGVSTYRVCEVESEYGLTNDFDPSVLDGHYRFYNGSLKGNVTIRERLPGV